MQGEWKRDFRDHGRGEFAAGRMGIIIAHCGFIAGPEPASADRQRSGHAASARALMPAQNTVAKCSGVEMTPSLLSRFSVLIPSTQPSSKSETIPCTMGIAAGSRKMG